MDITTKSVNELINLCEKVINLPTGLYYNDDYTTNREIVIISSKSVKVSNNNNVYIDYFNKVEDETIKYMSLPIVNDINQIYVNPLDILLYKRKGINNILFKDIEETLNTNDIYELGLIIPEKYIEIYNIYNSIQTDTYFRQYINGTYGTEYIMDLLNNKDDWGYIN